MNIGIILPHLVPSQLTFEVEKVIRENSEQYNFTVFYENLFAIYKYPSCPVMNISELKYFRKGRVVSFDISAANKTLKSVNAIEPVLYLYDLEWLRGKNDYVNNVSLLRKIKLITRSEEYKTLVENYTNSNCEVKTLKEVLCP
jgi:hypothetical protein